jgi:hypothetical protein
MNRRNFVATSAFAASPYGRCAVRPAIPDVRISTSELPELAALSH